MISKTDLEKAWTAWELELKELAPQGVDRRKTLTRIAELWSELSAHSDRLRSETEMKDLAQKYFGLDALKISALNISQNIESDERHLLILSFQHAYNLILSNVLRLRVLPDSPRRLQTFFTGSDIALFLQAKAQLDVTEANLWATRNRLQIEMGELRESYELLFFAESSYEASRSFTPASRDDGSYRSSWDAFSQLLTGVAVQVRDDQRALLAKRSRRIEAQRAALFENCAHLLAKKAEGKDAKKIQRQLRQNLIELKKLETEIETTLGELSIPGIGDQASLVVKKNPEQATTFQPTKMSQSTGDKT